MVDAGSGRGWKRTEVEKGTAERKRKGCVEFWARGVEGRRGGSRKKGREGGRRAWRGWNRNRNRKQGAQEDEATSTSASAAAPIWRKRRVCRKSPRKWNASQPANPCRASRPSPRLPHLSSRFYLTYAAQIGILRAR